MIELRIHTWLQRERLSLPIVLKPNEGQRGSGVVIAKSSDELHAYLRQSTVDTIPRNMCRASSLACSIAASRQRHGARSLVTEKRLPFVVGDGHRSLERLILRPPQPRHGPLSPASPADATERDILRPVKSCPSVISASIAAAPCFSTGARRSHRGSNVHSMTCREPSTASTSGVTTFVARSVEDFHAGPALHCHRAERRHVRSDARLRSAHRTPRCVSCVIRAVAVGFRDWRRENVRRGAETTSMRELVRLLRSIR